MRFGSFFQICPDKLFCLELPRNPDLRKTRGNLLVPAAVLDSNKDQLNFT